MIVLRSPKGWTGPKEVDGLPVEGTWRSHQVPSPRCGPTPSTSRCSRLDAELPTRGALRRRWRARAELAELAPAEPPADEREPARQRRPASSRTSSFPTSATTRSTCRRPRRDSRRRRPRVLGEFLRDVIARQPRQLPAVRSRRDGLEPARAVFEVTDRAWDAERMPTDEHLAPDGRVMEVLSEHLCQGWLEGYLLTGRHGLFNCYEAFIHIVDSMFNQHAKWLKVSARHRVAPPDRVAQLPALLARLATGPQRLLPPGPRVHRPRREQEGGDHPRLPAARRELPAVGRRPLPAIAGLRQRDRRRQAAGAELAPIDDAIMHCTRGARHLGVGQQRRRRRAGRRDGVLLATSRRWRRSAAVDILASGCPS